MNVYNILLKMLEAHEEQAKVNEEQSKVNKLLLERLLLIERWITATEARDNEWNALWQSEGKKETT